MKQNLKVTLELFKNKMLELYLALMISLQNMTYSIIDFSCLYNAPD